MGGGFQNPPHLSFIIIIYNTIETFSRGKSSSLNSIPLHNTKVDKEQGIFIVLFVKKE